MTTVPRNTAYDDSRISDYPDKLLLQHQREYFEAFVNNDYASMRAKQEPGYFISDISLGVVRVNRDDWYGFGAAFVSMVEDLTCTALAIDGSSRPGSFSVLENALRFKLKIDPPPSEHLPPGAKKGDTVRMIMCSIIWWGKRGQVLRELEYGRLCWSDFDIDIWKRGKNDMPVAGQVMVTAGSGFLRRMSNFLRVLKTPLSYFMSWGKSRRSERMRITSPSTSSSLISDLKKSEW